MGTSPAKEVTELEAARWRLQFLQSELGFAAEKRAELETKIATTEAEIRRLETEERKPPDDKPGDRSLTLEPDASMGGD